MSKLYYLPFACILTFISLSFGCNAPTPPPLISDSTAQTSIEESASPTPPEKETVWSVLDIDDSYISPARKLVAFTFDDAPRGTLGNLLAVFADFNEKNPDCQASATVFCNGNLLDENALSLLRVARVARWELGNHTQNHLDLTALSETELSAEIDKTDTLLSSVDGKRRHLLRAPFGRINARVQAIATTPIIDWTIDTLDWTGVPAQTITAQVLSEAYSGAIILMHDGYENTVEAVKTLLPALKGAGYQVVSVSAMAKAHACTLKNGSVYIRARKRGKA